MQTQPIAQVREVYRKNRLLSALPPDEFVRLARHLESVDIFGGTSVYGEQSSREYAYFPQTAIASIVRTSGTGTSVEVGLVGFEGLVGLETLSTLPAQGDTVIVQASGNFSRIHHARLADEYRRGGVLQEVLLRYAGVFLHQVSQAALCNRLHSLESRLARWLLMVHQRLVADEIRISQELLSHMLGVRLAGVNRAIGAFADAGIIRHRRNFIAIANPDELRRAACECLGLIQAEEKRAWLPPPRKRMSLV